MDLYTNKFYQITLVIYKMLILNLMFIGYSVKGFFLYGINPALIALVNTCSKEKLKNMEVEEVKSNFAEVYDHYKVSSITSWGITFALVTLYAITFIISHGILTKITASILLGAVYIFYMILVGTIIYSYFLSKGYIMEEAIRLMLKSFVDRPLKFIFLAIFLIIISELFLKNLFLVITLMFPIVIAVVREYIERILLI